MMISKETLMNCQMSILLLLSLWEQKTVKSIGRTSFLHPKFTNVSTIFMKKHDDIIGQYVFLGQYKFPLEVHY